ncbi:E3 ubiquitin ligase BIG BROTHER-related-like [Papaver somniferum]|uniref:E3 ubiquitin ligase BIG BROTHER-related-like n=1 Tax=Papaver somniferum TaxID=3469 RepID=UPI000E6FBD30|nr:E3 ubiquitin ligase BIG BROTHER-related-like [Papaver somniferum]
MSNKVGHEGTQPNQPSCPTSAQDLNQHRRQREEQDSNQSNQRRRVDDTSASEDNRNSSSLSISQENLESLREKFYLQWDRQMEEDAIHDSDNDDDDDDDETVEEESLDSDEGWNSNNQDDQNQEWTYRSLAAEVDHDILLAAEVVHDIEFRVTNEDGSVRRRQRYDFGMLISLNNNVGTSDIDGLSYEQLRELDESIVMVQRLSKEIISKQLKTRVHTTSADSTKEKIEICTVCQDGYENKDKIATLDCKHEYHEDCITQWLVRKNVCPICKRQALMMEESKGEEVNEC